MSTIGQQFKRLVQMGQETGERRLGYVSTGATPFNLALSGDPFGGWEIGHMNHIIGDSDTGKSMEGLTVLAEAAHNAKFDNYRLLHNDIEMANSFDITGLFGEQTESRLEYPSLDKDMKTIEEWEKHIRDLLDDGTPFIEVVDSWDSISSLEDQQLAEARQAGKDKGSYGTSKAKMASKIFPDVVKGLWDTGSMILLVSQTRDELNPANPVSKRFSGGRALWFYPQARVWLAPRQKIMKTSHKKQWRIGTQAKCFVQRTRTTGQQATVEFPIYWYYGIDDIGATVDLLIELGQWEQAKNSSTVKAPDLDLECTKEKLIREIENNDYEEYVKRLAGEVWNEAVQNLIPDRKHKYKG